MAFFKPQAIERAEQIMHENTDKDTGLSNWDAWNVVCEQIMTKWSQAQRSQLLLKTDSIIYPIEAKALHIFTFVQKHREAVDKLVEGSELSLWYVQYMILLCPIIELVGDARLSEKVKSSNDTALTSGAFWLFDPQNPNNHKKKDLLNKDADMSLIEILSARNYLLHGIKKSSSNPNLLPDIHSFEIPKNWRDRMQPSSRIYWRQLIEDDGVNTNSWINRLAKAQIYPFKIPGAEKPGQYFRDGYIAPDILRFLA